MSTDTRIMNKFMSVALCDIANCPFVSISAISSFPLMYLTDIVSINEIIFSRAMMVLVATYLRRNSRTLSYHYCERESPILKSICNLFFFRVGAALINLQIVFDLFNSLESKICDPNVYIIATDIEIK